MLFWLQKYFHCILRQLNGQYYWEENKCEYRHRHRLSQHVRLGVTTFIALPRRGIIQLRWRYRVVKVSHKPQCLRWCDAENNEGESEEQDRNCMSRDPKMVQKTDRVSHLKKSRSWCCTRAQVAHLAKIQLRWAIGSSASQFLSQIPESPGTSWGGRRNWVIGSVVWKADNVRTRQIASPTSEQSEITLYGYISLSHHFQDFYRCANVAQQMNVKHGWTQLDIWAYNNHRRDDFFFFYESEHYVNTRGQWVQYKYHHRQPTFLSHQETLNSTSTTSIVSRPPG